MLLSERLGTKTLGTMQQQPSADKKKVRSADKKMGPRKVLKDVAEWQQTMDTLALHDLTPKMSCPKTWFLKFYLHNLYFNSQSVNIIIIVPLFSIKKSW